MAYFLQDPSSQLTYEHDWTDWLEPPDAITLRQWTITPLNGTDPETPILGGATSQTVIVSGFQPGKVYRLTEQITTTAGLVDQQTIVIRCEET